MDDPHDPWEDFRAHRWSGWPGAWCLDCGREDPMEIALGNGDVGFIVDEGKETMVWAQGVKEHYDFSSCKEYGSNRNNPYFHRSLKEERKTNG